MKWIALRIAVMLAWLAGSVFAGEPKVTLRILALDRPQAAAEQRLADSTFTPATGIQVVLMTNSTADLRSKWNDVIAARDPRYDLVHYDNEWLGFLVASKALEPLDGPDYFGDDAHALQVTNVLTDAEIVAASTNTGVAFADFRPDVSFRLVKYPTDEDDLFSRRYARYLNQPVYGLPWNTAAQILVYRDDLLATAFARVQPAAAEFYRSTVEPGWKDQWRLLVSAAGLIQIVHSGVHGVVVRGSAGREGILQDFLPILWAFGGDICDEANWKVAGILNSETNVKALEFLCGWNGSRKIVAPDSANGGEAEAFTAFAEGKAAIGQIPPWYGPYLDDRSKAAGRFSYAITPGITAVAVISGSNESALNSLDSIKKLQTMTTIRRATLNRCEGVGINAFSKQKAAAWKYLQWLYSRQTQIALIYEKGSAFCSARKDLANESRSVNQRNRAVMEQFDGGFVRSTWNNPLADQLDAALALECNLAYRGVKTPKEALDAAAKQIQSILDEHVARPK